jgi:hypothetical protein
MDGGYDWSVVKSQLGSLGGVEDSRRQRESSKAQVLTSSVATLPIRVWLENPSEVAEMGWMMEHGVGQMQLLMATPNEMAKPKRSWRSATRVSGGKWL